MMEWVEEEYRVLMVIWLEETLMVEWMEEKAGISGGMVGGDG